MFLFNIYSSRTTTAWTPELGQIAHIGQLTSLQLAAVKKTICQHPRFLLLPSVQKVTERYSSQQQKSFKLYFNIEIQHYIFRTPFFFVTNCPKTKETVMLHILAHIFTKGNSSWWGLPQQRVLSGWELF